MSECVPYDNCERLGLCGKDQALPPPAEPKNETILPVLHPVPRPTRLCTDGAPGPAGRPNMIYLYGSADFGPLLRAAQPALSALPAPYRAVFQPASSCAGATIVFDPDPTKRVLKDPVVQDAGGWAFYFDENREQVNCRIEPENTPNPVGVPADIGISNIYAQTCNPNYAPNTQIAEYLGPIVPFALSVPAASREQAISAEAAHLVFGLGGKPPASSMLGDARPWTDATKYCVRNSGAASTVLTSLMIDVPRDKFWGVDRLSTENLRDSLLSSVSDSAIGILSIDFNDKNRGNLKALYLQARGQRCGYLPDSNPNSYDKSNVRDGHYPLWGYVHMFTRLGAGGTPSPAASAMVLMFNVPRQDQQLLDEITAASLIPQCAMKVTRAVEMGDFTPRSGFRCGCYFESQTRGGKSSCQTCARSEDCPSSTPSCNYGYCEMN